MLKKIILNVKVMITRLLGEFLFKKLFPHKKYMPKISKSFFQYEYSARQLKIHVEKQGFYISRYGGADLLYTFTEFGNHSDKFIKKGRWGYRISHRLENSWLSFLGAQSIVVAIKICDLMHCFFCGMKTAKLDSLKKYDVPICEHCETNSNKLFYEKGNKVSFHKKYIIAPALKPVENKICDLCKSNYETNSVFEDFGFDKNICPECLGKKNINIQLSNTSIQPIWRSRSSK